MSEFVKDQAHRERIEKGEEAPRLSPSPDENEIDASGAPHSGILRYSPGTNGILPCPFCGSRNTKLHDRHMAWVSCIDCGLEAPSETDVTIDQAITYWNTRAVVQRSQEPVTWFYEMAHYIKPSDENPLRDWRRVVTFDPPPTIPKYGVRNVVPLYASPPSPAQAQLMPADIAKIISEGWQNGKSASEIADTISREMGMPNGSILDGAVGEP